MNTATEQQHDDYPLWSTCEHPERPGMFLGFGMMRNGKKLRVISNDRDHLQQRLITMQLELAEFRDGDPFLAAWKRGVKIAGEEYFGHRSPLFGNDPGPAASVDEAVDKWQLAPKMEMVEALMAGGASRWSKAFVASLYSFYNVAVGAEFLQDLGVYSIGELAANLDGDRTAVLADLLVSYRGW